MKTKTKKDCFALNEHGRCTALKIKRCKGCSFYKSREQQEKERRLADKINQGRI